MMEECIDNGIYILTYPTMIICKSTQILAFIFVQPIPLENTGIITSLFA